MNSHQRRRVRRARERENVNRYVMSAETNFVDSPPAGFGRWVTWYDPSGEVLSFELLSVTFNGCPVDVHSDTYARSHGQGSREETEARRRAEQRERDAIPEDAVEATHVADRVQGTLDAIEKALAFGREDERYEGDLIVGRE